MKIRLGIIIVFVYILHSCSVEKFIPEDKVLYNGASVTIESDTLIENKDLLETELNNVVRPRPNKKILGMRLGLYYHYKAQREKPGFINKFLNKKLGEEPVYFSDVEIDNTEDLLLNRVENRGYFYSRVTSDTTVNVKDKIGEASYQVKIPTPYRMATYQLDTDSLLVYKDIKKGLGDTPLEKGMRFDLPSLKFERERIDAGLKKKGYYNFNSGFLIFEADTNQYNNKKFDLFLRLKNDVPPKSIIPYQISEVNVYPNYSLATDSVRTAPETFDNRNYFQEELYFKPEKLDPFILIAKGDYYDPEVSRNTSRRLGSIGAYKFVNIRYKEIDTSSTDSLGKLQANIFLSPLKNQAIKAELQAVTKSNSFAGPSLGVTYSNRNLFHGGELLNISASVGYEVQASSKDRGGLTSINLGLKGDLIFPRLVFPIDINEDFFKYSIPKTKISLGGEYLKRSKLYGLGSVTGSFGYFWNANRYVTHELTPISLNYVDLLNSTPEFDEILEDNQFLKSSFDQQFIAGLLYSFTYNGMIDVQKQNVFYINSNLDIAGNTISLLGKEGSTGKKEIFGIEYAQYAKANVDFRFHHKLTSSQTIATRLFAGIGIPYGNSDVMPFSKQYFSGGPYSVRAFRTRSLGPGTYNPESNNSSGDYFDQTGNIRLEANIEYRFPLFPPYLNGAVFADAGNVWNLDENASLPGGEFSSGFINELGIGAGVGVRVDIQSFVIRFDLAAPLHDPSVVGNAWVYDFGKPVFNFAIGYPF